MTLLVIADDEFATNRIPESKADLLISCGDMDTVLLSYRRDNLDFSVSFS